MTGAPQWTDAELLRVLHLNEVDGLSCVQIAQRFGVTRNAIVGITNRIRADMRKVPDRAVKPENRDGGMPARWWAAGLKVQGRAAL
jgi:hypothetical protein